MGNVRDQKLIMNEYTSDDDEILEEFYKNFTSVASAQGRCAYLIMSVHLIKPEILQNFLSFNPTRFLYVNMFYGIGGMIYARPNMRPIGFFNRLLFSILGTSMFNYSSCALFEYIRKSLLDKTNWAVVISFITGRVLMLHLLAYLYHVDIRGRDRTIPRNPTFDYMYLGS